MFGELLLAVIQVSVSAKRCKVVTMDDNTDVTGLVITTKRRGCTLCKTNSLKSAAITQFPYVTSVTASICTSHQSAHAIGSEAQLLGKVHEQIASGLTVEVGFSNVDTTDSPGLALSGSLGREL